MALINLFENVSIQFLLKQNAFLYRLLQDDLYILLALFITKLLLLMNLDRNMYYVCLVVF